MNDLELTQPVKPVKPCRKCGAVDRSPSGNCRPCGRQADRRRYAANPEARREVSRRQREANPEYHIEYHKRYREDNRKARCEASKRWREANLEAAREKDRLYNKANLEARREYLKQWRSAHPETRRAYNQNRRARIRSSGKLSPDISKRLMVLQSGKCACCKTKMESYHIDHIMPLALGGLNVDNNVQLLCPPCNLSKGAKHPVDFAQERGLLL